MDLNNIAQELLEAEKTRKAVNKLTDRFPSLSKDDAYRIQLLQIEDKVNNGHKIVGKKIGLTSKAMQDMLGVNEPDYGHILDSMMHYDGEALPIDQFVEPRLESEIAFILKDDLKGPDVTALDVIRATDYVVPAFEVIDSRIANWDIKFEDTVADNGSSARAVLGGKPTKLADVDLSHIGMNVYKNGKLIDQAAGAAVMGNPVEAIAWLANALSRFDIHLLKGEIILSGALAKAVPVTKGDTFRAEFAHIGSVEVSFE